MDFPIPPYIRVCSSGLSLESLTWSFSDGARRSKSDNKLLPTQALFSLGSQTGPHGLEDETNLKVFCASFHYMYSPQLHVTGDVCTDNGRSLTVFSPN